MPFMPSRRQWIATLGLALALSGAYAQEAPPIRLVVGFPAGDLSDVAARLVADKMRVSLKRPVLVDNRGGAGGMIAAEAVKSAAPDGTTLMLAPLATMVTFPYTFDKLRYDPLKDFDPVSMVATFDLALAVSADKGPRTVEELVQRARTDKTMAAYGSPGAGTLPHFFGLLLSETAKFDYLHIAYRGDAPAKQGLLGGEIGSMVGPLGSFTELERAGKVRVLATSGAVRNPMTPGAPTFKELGIDAVATPWFAMFAPAKTPRDVIARQAKAVQEAVSDPEVRARLGALGLIPVGSGPDELADVMQREHARWSVVIRKSGFKAN